MTWLFVDDAPIDARAFAERLGTGTHALEVMVATPPDAREQLLSRRAAQSGVLMDIDLSNSPGEKGSGPGLAQDLRVKQKAGEIPEYPIVRFAGRGPVERNVKGDPGSDDLFDLKILKEELADGLEAIQERLLGLQEVYSELAEADVTATETLETILGLTPDQRQRWSHEAFHDRLLSSLQVRTHVAAGVFMRGFLTPTGLLIGEEVLGYRLGIDPNTSVGWRDLVADLPFAYGGIGAAFYRRWWARGLDDWWFEAMKCGQALVSLTIEERVKVLGEKYPGLTPLVMPRGSAGTRPWRLCALSLEADPVQYIPVDPSESVRLTPRADPPIWTDPSQVALRVALQNRNDLRLNRSDVARLQLKYDGRSS